MNRTEDTIAAPVTAPGSAGVAVIRLSGPHTKAVFERICPGAARAFLAPRTAVFGPIYQGDWHEAEVLDEGLAIFFPGPNSYTGEDVVEFHLHGSPFLVKRLLSVLTQNGVRLARPGEFTERAFHAGKIDLSQAEAVADLINAETEIQARVAREQLAGKLSLALSELGEPLRGLLAEIEAYIDFPEEDINPLTSSEWAKKLQEVLSVLREYIGSFRTGRLCREGALVTLAGLPNAGKSSLLNALLGEDRAIVTALAGTTRDSIEERASINGLQVRFCDTAGLLEDAGLRIPDPVEKLGIERSWQKLEQADLVLFIFDSQLGFDAQQDVLAEVRSRALKVLIVANKSDLLTAAQQSALLEKLGEKNAVFVSALKGLGLSELRERILNVLMGAGVPAGSILVTNQRHFEALKQAEIAILDALHEIEKKTPAEFISIHLRAVLGALEDIIGVTHNEDILGLIFSKFCIGK